MEIQQITGREPPRRETKDELFRIVFYTLTMLSAFTIGLVIHELDPPLLFVVVGLVVANGGLSAEAFRRYRMLCAEELERREF